MSSPSDPLPLRLVYASESSVPSRTANAVHVMNMCAGLAELGADVSLLARVGRDGAEAEDPYAFYGVKRAFAIRRIVWPRMAGRGLTSGLHSLLHLRALRPDVVFGRNLYACWMAARAGWPVIFESHSPPWLYKPVPTGVLRDLLANPNLRGLVVISRPLEAAYRDSGWVGADKILVAADAAPDPAGVEPAVMGPTDRLQVGYVGHLYKGRGIDLLVDLARRCPFMDLHLVGGTEADIAWWLDQTCDLGNVHLHGFAAPAHAAALRAGCDVLLAPYQRKVAVAGGGGNTVDWMSPLKLFEYMAAGKATLCSDLPVLHEVMADGENCLLLPPEDADAWAAALTRLYQDRALCDGLGRTARRHFEERHSWTRRAALILERTGFVRSDAVAAAAP